MDPQADLPKMYTVSQTAVALNVTCAKIYRMIAEQAIPCVVLGPRTYRIKESDLRDLIS